MQQPLPKFKIIFPLNMVKAPAETILNRPTQKAAAARESAAAALLLCYAVINPSGKPAGACPP